MIRLAAIRDRLADDKGLSLPEVMIGALVSTATLGAIVGLVIGMSNVSISSLARSQAVVEQQGTEMQFRQDVAASTVLAADDSKHLIAVDGAQCVTSTWSIDTGGRINIDRAGALQEDGTCDTSYTATFDTMGNAGSDSQFSYTNRYGRTLTIVSGIFQADAATKPSGVSQADWDSTEASLVALSGITNEGSKHSRPFAFTIELPRGGIWTGPQTSTETP